MSDLAGPYSGHTVLDPVYTSKHAEVLTDRATAGLSADERQQAMLRTRELVRVVQSHQVICTDGAPSIGSGL